MPNDFLGLGLGEDDVSSLGSIVESGYSRSLKKDVERTMSLLVADDPNLFSNRPSEESIRYQWNLNLYGQCRLL